jgi:TRAP-type C4-dicarboxylate transport system substrate-binding protein
MARRSFFLKRGMRAVQTAVASVVVAGLLACSPPADQTAMSLVTVGGTEVAGSPGADSWLSFQQRVEEADPPLTLRMLTRGQLGSEEQLLSGLRRGRIQLASMSALAASALVPELTMLYAPFLFADEAEADHVLDEFIAEPLAELLATQGLHLVEWHEIGFHHVYAREPLLLPEQYRGVRFRVSASIPAQLFAQSLGADVISMGFADVVPALQTRLIDAGENAVPYYARTGIAEQAPHLILTGHALGMNLVLANASWWQSLSEEQRTLLAEAFPDRQQIRHRVRRANAAELAESVRLGFQVHTLDEAQRQRWRETSGDTHEALIRQAGGRSAEIHALALQGRRQWRVAGP